MTKAMKSLVLAAAVLMTGAGGVSAQTTQTSKCGDGQAKCVSEADLAAAAVASGNIDISSCKVKGGFNAACILQKVKEREALLNGPVYSKCDLKPADVEPYKKGCAISALLKK